MNSCQPYLDFVRYALNPETEMPKEMERFDWEGLFCFANEHAIFGVVFEGVQRMGEQGVKPPLPLLMDWVAAVEEIEDRNREVNRAAVKFLMQLRQDGFEGCILKGQGNNLMYPNVYSRMSGDIDVWVRKDGLLVGGYGLLMGKKSVEREVIRYVKERNPKARALYHHIDYGDFEDIEVEMHYRPSFMFNPVHNGRLQKWFQDHAEQQFKHMVELPDGVGMIAVPDVEFNIVFQLSHIYNHVLHEGIGLRQMMDYFFLLRSKNLGKSVEGLEGEDGLGLRVESLEKVMRRLGLWKIAGAVMWVLHEVLGLEEQYLIASMDERLGKVLLSEIMQGGNFGQYDEQNIRANNPIKKNWQRIRRDFRLMRYFPSECLWEPAFRLYHFFWRTFVRV